MRCLHPNRCNISHNKDNIICWTLKRMNTARAFGNWNVQWKCLAGLSIIFFSSFESLSSRRYLSSSLLLITTRPRPSPPWHHDNHHKSLSTTTMTTTTTTRLGMFFFSLFFASLMIIYTGFLWITTPTTKTSTINTTRDNEGNPILTISPYHRLCVNGRDAQSWWFHTGRSGTGCTLGFTYGTDVERLLANPYLAMIFILLGSVKNSLHLVGHLYTRKRHVMLCLGGWDGRCGLGGIGSCIGKWMAGDNTTCVVGMVCDVTWYVDLIEFINWFSQSLTILFFPGFTMVKFQCASDSGTEFMGCYDIYHWRMSRCYCVFFFFFFLPKTHIPIFNLDQIFHKSLSKFQHIRIYATHEWILLKKGVLVVLSTQLHVLMHYIVVQYTKNI